MIRTDLAMMPIWIGLLSVLLGTSFVRRAFADGTVVWPACSSRARARFRLPLSIPIRAIWVGLACALIFALPLSFLLPVFGDSRLSSSGAIGTKVLITVVCSLAIAPAVVSATARDVVPHSRG